MRSPRIAFTNSLGDNRWPGRGASPHDLERSHGSKACPSTFRHRAILSTPNGAAYLAGKQRHRSERECSQGRTPFMWASTTYREGIQANTPSTQSRSPYRPQS